ncbi:MAG: hypothetical protein WEA80_01960 [Gemmatimonadaceae bacterium]
MPKRFIDRARPALRRYQKILGSARKRDVNESDTSVIVSDMLTDLLGWDKYEDVTTELSVRSTFCDLAIKSRGRLLYLIEVKSIGTDLKDNHLRQAIEYGSREGIEWILLTNGVTWQAHRIRFEQPIHHDLVFEIDMLAGKPADTVEKLYLVSKEAENCSEIDLFWKHKEATSRYVVAQLLLDDASVRTVRRQLRRLFPGLKVSEAELDELIRTEVFKRDVLEGDKAAGAEKMIRKASRRRERARAKIEEQDASSTAAQPAASA